MAFTAVITNNAKSDIQEAINWYNEQQSELGKKFLEFVDEKINNLCITPGIGSIRYDEVRCTMLNVFPYIIHYSINKAKEEVIILRILHAFRKPIH
jgi:plasmid stabilization system protein ParE